METAMKAEEARNDSNRWASTALEYGKAILISLILALAIRAFVVQAYEIPSGSMEHTLEVGDRILVNKFIYGVRFPFVAHAIFPIREPHRGDVIVFAYPKDPDKDFIKRVIGIPGDKIRIQDKKVFVNGKVYENPHAIYTEASLLPGAFSPRDTMGEITVPDASYFVMGDNRDNSYDSRFWGFVKRDAIKGLAFIRYWSWDQENWHVRWSSIGNPID